MLRRERERESRPGVSSARSPVGPDKSAEVSAPRESQDAREQKGKKKDRSQSKKARRARRKELKQRKDHAKAMRKLSLYVSVAFKHPTLVALCMTVNDGSPIRMIVLVKRRYGGANAAGMIRRMQLYIASYPRGDIELWLDKNRYLEETINRDYGGKIPDDFFSTFLLMKFRKHPAFPGLDTMVYQFGREDRLDHREVERVIRQVWQNYRLNYQAETRTHTGRITHKPQSTSNIRRPAQGTFVAEREKEGKGECFECGGKDHWKSRCPKLQCKKCKGAKHNRAQCPRAKTLVVAEQSEADSQLEDRVTVLEDVELEEGEVSGDELDEVEGDDEVDVFNGTVFLMMGGGGDEGEEESEEESECEQSTAPVILLPSPQVVPSTPDTHSHTNTNTNDNTSVENKSRTVLSCTTLTSLPLPANLPSV